MGQAAARGGPQGLLVLANVVLVYPNTGLDVRGVSVWLPLAVLQVAATIHRDYDVVIVDQRTSDDWRRDLAAALDEDTLCVGISSMTGTQIKGGLEAARAVRELDPALPIVWGGNHPTLAPNSTARHPLVDVVVLGEGEDTFRRLVEALEKGHDWRGLPNLAFKRDGEVVRTGTGTDPAFFVDQDELPALPYHLVDVESYISGPLLFGRELRSLPYIGSVGCPYPCTFCCQPVLSSRRWRKQSPEVLLERTHELVQKYALDAIEFHDEEFFVDRKRGAAIAERIGGDYDWYVQTRMDDLLHLDLDLLERNGLRVVQPGLETGSPRILEPITKRETLDDFHGANRKLATTGIRSTYNFMMGYPTETDEDLIATVDLALQLLDENPNASISGFYVFVPYPGSELFDLAVRDGFVPPDTLEGWSAFNRQHLDTPWIKERRGTLEMLLYSSKFIDGQRLKRAFSGNPVAQIGIEVASRMYRARWRRHWLRKTPDINGLAFAARHVFNW